MLDGINVMRTSPNARFARQIVETGQMFARHRLWSYDLVHGFGGPQVVLAACIWARLFNIPTVREMTLDEPIQSETGLKGRVVRRSYTSAKKTIALTPGIAATLRDIGVPPGDIHVRPNPVDTGHFRPQASGDAASARDSFGISDNARLHVMVGRFMPRKNQHFAIDVLIRLPEHHHLLLVGPAFEDDQAYLADVHRRIGETGLADRVHLLPTAVNDPLAVYHAADTLWLPSRREGLPNVALEALCCGVPVIANAALELSDHIRNGENGANVDLDADQFAQNIIELEDVFSQDTTRRSIAASAALLYGAEHLDAQFAELLSDLLKLRTNRASHAARPQTIR